MRSRIMLAIESQGAMLTMLTFAESPGTYSRWPCWSKIHQIRWSRTNQCFSLFSQPARMPDSLPGSSMKTINDLTSNDKQGLICHKTQTDNCPIRWSCRLHRLHLCRGVRPPPHKECPVLTLNNLMVRFQ